MTKLVVEEGGKRRAFKLGEGILTVGSGPEARLRLESTEVAEVHLELERSGERCTLRPRPGVVPPEAGGRPIKEPVELVPGQRVSFGGVELWLDGEPPAHTPAAPRTRAPEKAAGGRSQGRPRIQAPAGVQRGERPGAVRHQRRTVKKGIPGWLLGGLILVGAILGLFVLKGAFEGAAKDGAGPVEASLDRAQGLLDEDSPSAARAQIEGIAAGIELTVTERTRRDRLMAEIDRRLAEGDLAVENQQGTKYLDVKLKRYEERYLTGQPESPAVRLFLKRCQEFRRRWPKHPELPWVERQERRLSQAVDLSAPPTFPDIEWEVEDLTDTSPRNYAEAFALLDGFVARTEGRRLIAAEALRRKLEEERREYHTDRLYQAKYDFEEKKSANQSVWWLVHSIAWMGDEAMENEAAELLIKMPEVDAHLRGYREDYPRRYAAVMANPVVAAWARETGYEK